MMNKLKVYVESLTQIFSVLEHKFCIGNVHKFFNISCEQFSRKMHSLSVILWTTHNF